MSPATGKPKLKNIVLKNAEFMGLKKGLDDKLDNL